MSHNDPNKQADTISITNWKEGQIVDFLKEKLKPQILANRDL